MNLGEPVREVRCWVDGAPIPWRVVTNWGGGVSLDTRSKHYQARIARALHQAATGVLAKGPVSLVLVLVHPRPKRLGEGPRAWHFVKPDIDRVLRNVLDGCQRGPTGRSIKNKAGVLLDDKLVCCVHVLDYYASSHEQPHIEIRLTVMDD